MKRLVLKGFGKLVLAVCTGLWAINTNWTLKLHQKLSMFAIDLNFDYDLELWGKEEF